MDHQQQSTELREIQQQKQHPSLGSSSSSSSSVSISIVKLDELSSFGATKQNRLPALIKLNEQQMQSVLVNSDARQPSSVPTTSAQAADATPLTSTGQDKGLISLPTGLKLSEGKENCGPVDDSDDFQMLDVAGEERDEPELVGPSLPQPQTDESMQRGVAGPGPASRDPASGSANAAAALANSLQYADGQPSHLGDSLIDMIINLRNENQNLVKALETNNEYVKVRLSEFKRIQEEAKRREAQFALDKADYEHETRKLKRQNQVLSDRLKSMEAKLKDMKLEVSDSLAAAHSSQASSVREQPAVGMNLSSDTSSDEDDEHPLYPELEQQSFKNPALGTSQQQVTMQMDATSGELYHPTDAQQAPSAPRIDADHPSEASRVAAMGRDSLAQRFEAEKVVQGDFFAIDDPMKQCDRLEQQLNEIGKRDYEICLLQQQLNILRQDFRLERMATLDAKIQIAKLKNDIDRLCLERQTKGEPIAADARRSSFRGQSGAGVRFEAAAAAADAALSKIGHQLGRRATKSAMKAAKYAAKQAHREEKAAAKAAASAAATAAYHASRGMAPPPTTADGSGEQPAPSSHSHHGRHHHRGRHGGSGGGGGAVRQLRAVKNEVVSDLLSTANKAMLTGYKMASTHVNLALDKLSAFEQQQAANLAANSGAANQSSKPREPSGPPSID